MDLYFERHDGDAATVEDFLTCFDAVSDRDLTPFMIWYNQAGTPELTIKTDFDGATGIAMLNLRQHTKPTPGQTDKQPLMLPVKIALFDPASGRRLATSTGLENPDGDVILVMQREAETLRFEGLPRRQSCRCCVIFQPRSPCVRMSIDPISCSWRDMMTTPSTAGRRLILWCWRTL
jgi:aminopeptidase N